MKEQNRLLRSKKAEQFDQDNELWESRKLGASPDHVQRSSPEQEKAFDEATGLQLLTFRIQTSTVEKLKQLAKLEGIGYQPFMRQILVKYVRENEHRIEQVLMAKEASERAEQMFVQAVKYKQSIANLEPMTNERITAECNFSKSLSGANNLFSQANEKCSDPVLKKHLKLRLNQIETLLDEASRAT